MASLIQVRDLLALRGRMEAAQISQTLNTPQPMINAMLQQLESMGKAVRIQEEPDGCLCAVKLLEEERERRKREGKACLLREWWALR
ncbi:[Fe-S]-dependent transcriptional repressor FeoC [Escherichia coli]|nr:[Fe-S]-dependent transcriptional repressor FeoC [Escherichia coli]